MKKTFQSIIKENQTKSIEDFNNLSNEEIKNKTISIMKKHSKLMEILKDA